MRLHERIDPVTVLEAKLEGLFVHLCVVFLSLTSKQNIICLRNTTFSVTPPHTEVFVSVCATERVKPCENYLESLLPGEKIKCVLVSIWVTIKNVPARQAINDSQKRRSLCRVIRPTLMYNFIHPVRTAVGLAQGPDVCHVLQNLQKMREG